MPAQHRNYISQTNVKLPNDLKEWARQQASQDFQSLSGFISKLINEGKNVARPQKQFVTPNWVHQYNTYLYKPRHAFCVSFLLILPTKTILRSG